MEKMKKKLKNKLILKYMIFLVTILVSLSIGITAFLPTKGCYLFFWGIFLVLSVILSILIILWNKTFSFDDDIKNESARTAIYSLFSEENLSDFSYYEYIIWLSWGVIKEYNYGEFDEEINLLKLYLDGNVKSKAYICKDDFKKVCKILSGLTDKRDRCDYLSRRLEEKFNISFKNSKLLNLLKDKNIITYCVIILLHLIACFLPDEINNFSLEKIKNVLFYIPGDILVILIYKGFIQESDNKNMNI